jgi:hypothetical protein
MRPEIITVVTGVPRSGTSLLMQMLVAGGLDALTDGVREPDPHNPRGYYELEAVKSTRRDASWVRDAPGHVVKVIHALVPALPDAYAYRVLLVERDLREVIRSQEAMLEGEVRDALPAARLAQIFEAQLGELRAWSQQHRVPLHELRHADLLRAPEAAARSIADFLNRELDVAAMAQAVVPDLYRQRSG